jgi:hypothetical protein
MKPSFIVWLVVILAAVVGARIVVAYCPSCTCYDCLKWLDEPRE